MPDFDNMTNEEVQDAIFGSHSEQSSMKESFDSHVVTIILLQGEGEQPTPRFECKSADDPKSACSPEICAMKDVYDNVGWEVFRAAGEIELVKLSARVDWSDSEEPWIDVEP